MARESREREDLLRDATALVTRIELSVLHKERSMEVFAGFRAQGAASFYFNQDPVFHFNARSQLRRAFVNEALIKAERGGLISLRRQPAEGAVLMERHVMSADEQRKFCQSATRQLAELRQAMVEREYVVAGYVAPKAITCEEVVVQLVAALEACESLVVAASPRVGG